MKEVFILIGLSGSGQEKFISDYKKGIDEKIAIINKDTLPKDVEKLINSNDQKRIIVDLGLITKSKRKKFFQRFLKPTQFYAIYFSKPFEQVVIDNLSIPYQQLKKEYTSLELPDNSEGWYQTLIIYDNESFVLNQRFLFEKRSEEELFCNVLFDEVYNYEQQKPELDKNTVSRHMWLVYQQLFEDVDYDSMRDKYITVTAGLFHDLGKPFCHMWSEEKQKYSHTGHDRVGAQMFIPIFSNTFSDEFLLDVALLIANHMKMRYNPELAKKCVNKPYLLEKLHKADENNDNRLKSRRTNEEY